MSRLANYLLWIVLLTIIIGRPHASASAQCGEVVLNEIDYDQVGTDQLEFIEITGNPGVELTGLEIHLINGLNGVIYQSQSLTGPLPQDGYYVLGSAAVSNVDQVMGSGGSNLIQNGAPDGVGIWDAEIGAYCDFINYEGVVAGFEDWPDVGTDPADLCGTGTSDSLARPERTSLPGDAWVIGACASPGEPNLGPTAVHISKIALRSLSTLGMISAGLFAGGVLLLVNVLVISREQRNPIQNFPFIGRIR